MQSFRPFIHPSIHPSSQSVGRSAPWPSLASCLSSCCLPSQACRQPKLRWRQMLWMTDSPGEPKKAKQNEARIVDKKNTITRRCQNPVVYLKAALFLNPTLVSRFPDSLLADHFHKNLTCFFFFFFQWCHSYFTSKKKHFRIPPIVNYNSDEMQNKKETMIYHRQK